MSNVTEKYKERIRKLNTENKALKFEISKLKESNRIIVSECREHEKTVMILGRKLEKAKERLLAGL